MLLIRLLLVLVLAVFCASFVWAGKQANLVQALSAMASDPWGAVTLLDLYTGLIVVSIWIFHVERRSWVAALWTVGLFGLGNFATLLYLLGRSFKVQSPCEMFLPRESASRE